MLVACVSEIHLYLPHCSMHDHSFYHLLVVAAAAPAAVGQTNNTDTNTAQPPADDMSGGDAIAR